MRITIKQNGIIPLKVPKGATYTVVYSPQTMGGATVKLLTFDDVPLKNGTLDEADQYRVDHGNHMKISIEVTGFSTAFVLNVLHGKTS